MTFLRENSTIVRKISQSPCSGILRRTGKITIESWWKPHIAYGFYDYRFSHILETLVTFFGAPKKWNDAKDHIILCSHIFQHLLSRKMFKNTSFTHRGQSNPGTALRYGIQTYPFSTLGGGDRRRHRNEGIFALLIFWSLAFHILIQQAVTVFTQFTTFHTCVVYQKKYPALFDRSGICKV